MKKIFLNVMMLLAVAITAVCACSSDVDTVKPDDKSISILAIGNSFSVDAMEYLYGILKEGFAIYVPKK